MAAHTQTVGKALRWFGAAGLTLVASGALVPLPVSFNTPLVYLAGVSGSMVAADFNGDGKQDLAVTIPAGSFGPGKISILRGSGNGTFAPPFTFDVNGNNNPVSMVVGDFNGDGKPDLAVANIGVPGFPANNISVLMGNGNGTFQPAVNYIVGTLPDALAVGDFNGDSKLDLAVANHDSNNYSILLGNGDGTFQPAVNYAGVSSPGSLIVADFNGDGKPDLAMTTGTSSVSILLGKGDGTFQAALVSNVGTYSYAPSLAAGDFNGDGKQDLAVAFQSGSSTIVAVLLGNGTGTFQPAVKYAVASTPTSVAVSDFNGDGKQDLAVTISVNTGGLPPPGNVAILLGKGDGTFGHAANYMIADQPYSLAVADFNGDQKRDVAVVSSSGWVSILLGHGDGTFPRGGKNYTVGRNPDSVASGDFNGDGKRDLAAANVIDNNVSILLGNGNGTFQPAVNYTVGSSPISVVVGDFNGDGKSDLAVANQGSATISILLGNGDGAFRLPLDSAVGNQPASMAVGDFNGDGKPDLVTGNTDGTFAILLGKGDGTFQPAANHAAGSGTVVAVGDFNGDGKLDLALGSGSAGTISILLGKGDGTFQPAVNYGAGNPVGFIAVGDLNKDGKLDLAVAQSAGSQPGISILLGNGDGTFQPPVNYAANGGGMSVAVDDFNGDGKPDVAVANTNQGGTFSTVSILLGKGDGTFRPSLVFLGGVYLNSIATGDFNGDGKLDLAMTNGSSNVVTVLMNTTL